MAAAAIIVVVIVVAAVAAADLGGRWVVAVPWHPFYVDDAISPCVLAGRIVPCSTRWILHQVKVHQYPERESAAATSRWTIVKFGFPA